MTTWFTSDPHWGHKNILTYCQRPFQDLNEMHQAMRDRWNEVVAPSDTVWLLGDFVFGTVGWGTEILQSLAGRKHLIQGNHDRHKPSLYLRMGFETVQTHAEIVLEGLRVRMRHRPPALTEEPQLTLCGHVHERWAWDPARLTLNVGVDMWDFRPISAEQVASTLVKARNKSWAEANLRLYSVGDGRPDQ